MWLAPLFTDVVGYCHINGVPGLLSGASPQSESNLHGVGSNCVCIIKMPEGSPFSSSNSTGCELSSKSQGAAGLCVSSPDKVSGATAVKICPVILTVTNISTKLLTVPVGAKGLTSRSPVVTFAVSSIIPMLGADGFKPTETAPKYGFEPVKLSATISVCTSSRPLPLLSRASPCAPPSK